MRKIESFLYFGGKIGFLMRKMRVFVENEGLGGFMVENQGFGGKMVVFLENEVFVGFWSRNRGKVGKSREFDDFLKIGENR